MAICMRALRSLGNEADCMEEVADRIVRYFYENFKDPVSGANEFALVRFYKIHEFASLPEELATFVQSKYANLNIGDQTKCMVLLATAGEQAAWNSRELSAGHKAIPLPSVEIVEAMPMVYQAISQLGLELEQLIKPERVFLVSEEARSYNVFYVPDALGSPYIPAQEDFVRPFGIKSVLGFGGMLPSGNLFVVIIFAKRTIPVETAEIFKSLAIGAKVSVVPFDEIAVFKNKSQ